MNWAVIMAGGSGERFWPLSRRKTPKQLLPIVTKRSMIWEALSRLQPLVPLERVVIVTNVIQQAAVRKAVSKRVSILAEPVGRNTAPCIAWAMQWIKQRDPKAIVAVVPADSHISNQTTYKRLLRDSFDLAGKKPVLVTVGIRPTRPATGYGYIQLGKALPGTTFYKVAKFVEKPKLSAAKRFIESGRYRWNAGMFVWSVQEIERAFLRYDPFIWQGCGQITNRHNLQVIYPRLTKISIDYAIMEKADNVVVADSIMDWDDVGDWCAVERHWKKDSQGNAVRGDFIGVDAKNCTIVAKPGHLVGAIGVSGLVIVHTPDATLVCRKEDSQRVRELVAKLSEKHR